VILTALVESWSFSGFVVYEGKRTGGSYFTFLDSGAWEIYPFKAFIAHRGEGERNLRFRKRKSSVKNTGEEFAIKRCLLRLVRRKLRDGEGVTSPATLASMYRRGK